MLAETVVKVVDRLVPTDVTAVIMTTAINAAMRPYSMAVAPGSFDKNSLNRLIMTPNFAHASATQFAPVAGMWSAGL